MTAGNIDPERLALLLEGKLGEPERSELLARLASSEEDLGAMVDASDIANDVADSTSYSSVPRRRSPPWFDWRSRYALAAAILFAVTLPTALILRQQRHADDRSFASIIIDDGRTPGTDVAFAQWPATRSTDEPVITAAGRSIRLGARSTDLEFAVKNGDSRSTTLAIEMAGLLDGVPGAGPIAQMYRSIATRSVAANAGALTLVKRGQRALQQLPGDSLIIIGAWLEAGRLAAHQRDLRFFDRHEAKKMASRVSSLPALPDSMRAPIASLANLASASESEWESWERLLGDVLFRLGS